MRSTAASHSSSASLALHLFGPFEASVRGVPLPRLRSQKGQWLLALLALHANKEVERPWLAALLWPDSPDPAALANLRTSLKDLRRALGAEAARLRAPTVRTLALDLTGAAVDVLAFDAALARGDPASLREAVALGLRGPLLERCSEEWVFQERRVREEAYLGALERLAAAALAEGDPGTAERWLRQAVAVDPLRETAQRALMQALAAGGNYGAALRVYRELRQRLHRELNAAPDPETQTLFQQLRSEARRRAARGERVKGRRGEGVKGSPSALPAHPFTPSPFHPLTPSSPELPAALLREALTRGPMVGRGAELGVLERRIEAALAAEGGVVLLAGEPGIGKTRLANEACALARQQGFRVLRGRCDEAGAAPYQPFVDPLREYLDRVSPQQAEAVLPPPVASELARLIPRLAEKVKEVPSVAAAAGAAARQALVEATGEFFTLLTTGEGPALLFLDDLHWADEGSLAMLHHLARRAKELPLLVVGTYRDLPPDLQHPLEETLAALNRERLAERLPLRRLPEAEVAQMVMLVLGCRLSVVGSDTDNQQPTAHNREPTTDGTLAAFVTALHRQTQGNPFFIEEVLQHLVEEGAIFRQEGRWQIRPLEEFRVPSSIKAAIGRRLERLSEASREALTLAAVIGPQFDFEVLLAAIGTRDEGRGMRDEIRDEGRGTRDANRTGSSSSLIPHPSSLRRSSSLIPRPSSLVEERLLGMLDEWLGAHLVIEVRAAHPQAGTRRERSVRERYRFQHALIREVLYDALNGRRKARLHERAGLALEAVYARDEGYTRFAGTRMRDEERTIPSHPGTREAGVSLIPHPCLSEEHLEELAHHFAQARSTGAMEKGVDYCLRVGMEALRLYANENAIQHLTAALALLDGLPSDEEHLRRRWEVAMSLGRAYRRCWAFERDREVRQEYLALAERVGNPWAMAAAYFDLGSRPDLERSLQIAQEHGLTDWQARAQVRLADLCNGQEPLRAEALLRQVLQAPEWQAPEYLPNWTVQTAYDLLMRVYVVQGKWDELAATLRQSISSGATGPLGGGYYLSTMEEALDGAGKRAEFLAFCEEAKALYAQAGLPPPLNQWYLEPAIPSTEFRPPASGYPQFRDEFEAPELRPEWQWHDPAQVSSYSLSERPGYLTLRPGERVSLYPGLNLNAPRMLLQVCGDFALETKMERDERVGASSGLLVWKDVLNYVRFDKQGMGQQARSIRLQGRIRGKFWIWGQGLLRGDTFHLRLERTGDRFAAFCRPGPGPGPRCGPPATEGGCDGEHWLTCGHVDFAIGDPLRVGVWAAWGMPVHFDYVQVLGRG